MGDHQSLLARCLKAPSLSLLGMISLADPTWRKHSTIWSSSGSRLAMLKYLAAGVVVVVSLICSNPSEKKTIRANVSAAASLYQPPSNLIACLVLVASLLNLSNRVATSVLRLFWASLCVPPLFAAPMTSVLSTSPGFPRSISLPDAIHHLMMLRWPQRAALRSGVRPSLVGSFTLTLESFSSSRTQEVCPPLQAKKKGSPSSRILQIDSNVRMCQQQWNHEGSTASNASVVQEGPPIFMQHVHLETRILSHQLSHLLCISFADSFQHGQPPKTET